MLTAALALSGCLLTNIPVDDCTDDKGCIAAFGYGSTCSDGFCSEPMSCQTGHDCRLAFGGGACVDGFCVDRLPPDPLGACTLNEPHELPTALLIGEDAPVVVGGMFRLDDTADPPRADGARLAVREINDTGGLVQGRPLAMVLCDNGGEGNSLQGAERQARIEGVLDYLAGTLGVPFVIGPGSSSDALLTVNHLVSQGYPTLLMSPSATSPALSLQPDRLAPEDEYGLFWRTAPSDALQGDVLANVVVGTYPLATAINDVSVTYISDAYGEGLANVFQEEHGAMNTTLHPFDDETFDAAALANDIDANNPDAIMIVAIKSSRTVALIGEFVSRPNLTGKPIYLTDGSKDATTLLDSSLPADVQLAIFADVVGTAPAGPQGEAGALFAASFMAAFDIDPSGFSFTANAYDGLYAAASSLVFASRSNNNYDGRVIASGLTRLISGDPLQVGKSDWPAIKAALTEANTTIDIVGVSGGLDFDPALGEPPAPIEVWRPSNMDVDCPDGVPCLATVTVR